jgi:hypothetical protein
MRPPELSQLGLSLTNVILKTLEYAPRVIDYAPRVNSYALKEQL